MLCALILHVDSEPQILENRYIAGLFTLRTFARNLHADIFGHYNPSVRIIDLVFPEICSEKIAEKIFFFYFVLMPNLEYEPVLYV